RLHSREVRVAQLATLEEHVDERRAAEVGLAHAAVAEHDALELGEAKPRQVEPALGERDVLERRLGELRPREPAQLELDTSQRESQGPAVRPILAVDDGVGEILELLGNDGVVVRVGWIRRAWSRHGPSS